MRKLLAVAGVLVVALPLLAPRAEAQFVFIPYLGYDFDVENLFIGAAVEVGLVPMNGFPVSLNIRPGAEVYLVGDDGSLFQINGEVVGQFAAPGAPLGFFAGAGVGLAFSGNGDTTSEFGINLLGGATFGTGFAVPFVQARLTTPGTTRFQLMGGVRLNV